MNARRTMKRRYRQRRHALRAAMLLMGVTWLMGAACCVAGEIVEPPQPTIPLDQLGLEVQRQMGDGSDVEVTRGRDGAKMRAPLQDLEAEATVEGLWISSVADKGPERSGRFRVRAVEVSAFHDPQAGANYEVHSVHVHDGRPTSMGHRLHIAEEGTVSVGKEVVSYTRPGLIEEYSTSVDGVRQDFIVMKRPAGGMGPLSVRLEVSGARVEAAEYGAKLTVTGGGREIGYSRLKVIDAAGRTLPAQMRVEAHDRLRIVVDDGGAVYPVRIDPTFSDADWVSMGSVAAGPDGAITAFARDPSGNLYVAGNFTKIGGITTPKIAKWDGQTWSALGPGITNGTINAMAWAGNFLFVGGSFNSVDGNTAIGLARWNGSAWTPMSLGVSLEGSVVHAMAVSGNNIYIGGDFIMNIGFSYADVLWFDTTNLGTTHHINGHTDGAVRCLATTGSTLYVGGDFATAAGIICSGIARWNGTSWSALHSSGMNGSVRALAVSGANLYAGGTFTFAGGVSAARIAVWNGTSWSAVGSGLNNTVNSLTVSNGEVYAGGAFTSSGATSLSRIAKWNGTAWAPLGSGVNGTVNTIFADPLNRLFVGGSFTTAGTISSPNFAAAFTNGSPDIAVEQPASTDLVDGTANVGIGPVNINATGQPTTFTIRNTGNGDLMALAVTKDGTHAGEFTIDTTAMATTLAPAATTTFTVTFAPTGPGPRTAALHIASNELGAESSFDIALTGVVSSTNANLSGLALSSGSLSPAFSSGTTSYTASVANSVASVTVTPTTELGVSTVSVNGTPVTSGNASGAIGLAVGNNAITTVVTAEDGTTTKTYTVTVNRAPSSNADLAGLSISAGTLTPAFSTATTSYGATVFLATTTLTVTPTVADSTATVRVNGTVVASGSPSDAITLTAGMNTITTEVTAQDGTTVKTYTLSLNRVPSNVAALANLAISAGPFTPSFATQTTNYSKTVFLATTATTVTPTVVDSTSIVTVNGVAVASGAASDPINLAAGINTITTVVIAQDGTTTSTYTLTINRVPSNVADLANFTVSSGTFTPVFAAGTLSYSMTVPVAVPTLEVTPTAADSTAVIRVNGNVAASGVATGPIALGFGNNTINTVLTAQDGITVKTYALNVFRTTPDIAIELAATSLLDGAPAPVDYGEISVENTKSFVFTIKNTGNEDLTGLGITVSGYEDTVDNDGDMSVDEADESGYIVIGLSGAPLAPGGSTTFTVRFDPYQPGIYNAVLHVASNDPDETPFDIALTAGARTPVRGAIAIDKPAGSTIVAAEGTTAQIPIIRTGGFDGPVGFSISTTDGDAGAGTDYTAPPLLQNLANGQTTLNVPIPILNPAGTNELSEGFTVTIGSPTGGATLGAVTTVTVVIGDSNDSAAPAAPVITAPTTNEVIVLAPGALVNFTGAATDNKGVASVKLKLNKGAFVETALDAPGTPSTGWSLALKPAEGANTITVQSFDPLNGASTQVTRSFTVLRALNVTVDTSLGSVTTGYSPTSNREANRSYTLVATPKSPGADFEGALFTGWTLGGQDVNNNNAPFTPQRLGMPSNALEKQSITFILREGLSLQANFIPNPYAPLVGSYNGLIRPSATLPDRAPLGGAAGDEDGSARTNATEGRFTATVQNTGAFSGTLTLDGVTVGIAGAFDRNGEARFGTARLITQSVARANKPGLLVALHANIAENEADETVPDKITGTVVTSGLKKTEVLAVSEVDGDRAFYNGTTRIVPAPYLGASNANGKFTVVFPPKEPSHQPPGYAAEDFPQGFGTGTLIITKAGGVTLTGTLADGVAISASSALSQADTFPLFAQMYNKQGFVSGQVELDSTEPASDLSALDLQWLRPFMGTSHYYPSGWNDPPIKVDLIGARYAVTAGQSVMRNTNGGTLAPPDADGNVQLRLIGGRLSEDLIKEANLSVTDVVTKVPTNDPTFTLSINRATGAVSGTFDHTDDTRPTYQAIIYQKGSNAGAFGYFLTKQPVPIDFTGESGSVHIPGQP